MIKRFLIIFLLLLGCGVCDTEFAKPLPSIEHPRQFVFPITSDDENEISHVLSSTSNVMKFYGPNKCEVAIVCYSKGIKTILKDAHFFDKDIQKKVRSLMTYDVEFIACQNTLNTYHIKKSSVIKNVKFVTAGIVELIERQKRGWTYIRP